MSLSRVKIWNVGEVLGASDLNGEFNNILTFLNGSPIIAVDGLALVEGDQLRWRGSAWANAGCQPTRQILTTGSAATYTTPANCRQLRIRMVGGGGGGSGSGSGAANGVVGGDTLFNAISAKGGNPGVAGTGSGGNGGSGGTGTASIRSGGGGGGGGGSPTSGPGGSSALGGGGASANAAGGYGGGGAGGPLGLAASAGAGGGGGEYAELIIDSPSTTYLYTIGPAGTAGAAGSPGVIGSVGKPGIIIVDEFY
jgi:hypothetical protein